MTRMLSPKHSTLAALAVVALLPAVVACGSKDNTAQTPTNPPPAGNCPPNAPPGYPGCTAMTGQAGYGAPPAQQPYAGPAAQPYGGPTAAPTMAPPPPAAPPPTAAPTAAPPMMGGDPIDLAIRAVAQVHAPGMQPEGARFNGQVAAGGNTMTTVTLQAGKCYSVVVYPNPPIGGVTSMKAELLAPLTQGVVESKSGGGPNGIVLGAGNNCISPLVPIPTPYSVRVTANAGTGGVAVQLFSKIK